MITINVTAAPPTTEPKSKDQISESETQLTSPLLSPQTGLKPIPEFLSLETAAVPTAQEAPLTSPLGSPSSSSLSSQPAQSLPGSTETHASLPSITPSPLVSPTATTITNSQSLAKVPPLSQSRRSLGSQKKSSIRSHERKFSQASTVKLNERILFAEDNEVTFKMTVKILEKTLSTLKKPASLELSRDGEAALKFLNSLSPDNPVSCALALTDVEMGHGKPDGYAVAKAAKSKNIPTVLVTGNVFDKDQCKDCGADVYVVKPFTQEHYDFILYLFNLAPAEKKPTLPANLTILNPELSAQFNAVPVVASGPCCVIL